MSTYEISKSSLLSLKAEILRKQEEVNKAKLQNKSKLLQQPKKVTPLEVKNKGVEQREVNDIQEDEDLLKKSKERLELKAKLYEELSSTRNELKSEQSDYVQRYLVHFEKKKSQLCRRLSNENTDFNENLEMEDDESHTEYEPAKNPDEEWVEYIDCLGRTRMCMRKDLEFLKSNDADLRASIGNDSNKVEQLSNKKEKEKEEPKEYDENSELLSADMRREMLRKQWEKEEEELAKKENIHYQDVLFNEARTHGVGYYAFSKDEEQRARQQEALKKLRQETEEEQKKAQELRLQRDKQLAARLKAARNRKRARLGLPPEEDEPETAEPAISKEKEKEKEEEQKRKEELEKEQIRKLKETHIRPWDIGKEGVKEHYVYSQEEWVEKKRSERPTEFAPPKEYSRSNFRSKENVKDVEYSENDKKLYFSTKKRDSTKDGGLNKSSNPYKTYDETTYIHKKDELKDRLSEKSHTSSSREDNIILEKECDNYSPNTNTAKLTSQRISPNHKNYDAFNDLNDRSASSGYCDTALNKKVPTTVESTRDYYSEYYRNNGKESQDHNTKDNSQVFQPTPIVNECEDVEEEQDRLLSDYDTVANKNLTANSSNLECTSRGRGVEVAPPPTYEYYGPSVSKKTKYDNKQDIEEAISAGLKFLRQQFEKKKTNNNRDSEMFIM